MARFKKRINWKGIVAAVLTVAIILGVAAGITAFAKNDTKTISSLSFSKGDLDENGRYVASETALYTKDAFECIGLRVEPDFEFNGTYDIYYYSYDGVLVEKVLDCNGIYDKEQSPLTSTARIVIHPAIPEDVDEDDFKINFYEVQKYASQINITVDKKQYEGLYVGKANLYEESLITTGKSISGFETTNTVELTEVAGAKTTHQIEITEDVSEFHIFIRTKYPPTCWLNAGISDSEGKLLRHRRVDLTTWFNGDTDKFEWVKLVVEVPENDNVDHLRVSMPVDSECYIFAID